MIEGPPGKCETNSMNSTQNASINCTVMGPGQCFLAEKYFFFWGGGEREKGGERGKKLDFETHSPIGKQDETETTDSQGDWQRQNDPALCGLITYVHQGIIPTFD